MWRGGVLLMVESECRQMFMTISKTLTLRTVELKPTSFIIIQYQFVTVNNVCEICC